MEITKEFLREQHACEQAYRWFLQCGETEHEPVIRKLMAESHHDWAHWVIVRIMTREQQIRYAIFVAESVLRIYEEKYPDDKRPRKAIEAAKAYLADQTEENRAAAYAAARAAYSANDAAYTAHDADDVAYAAYAAGAAAYTAYDARAAAHDADDVAYAAYAAYAAGPAALKTIIEYGLQLLKED